MHEQVKGLVSLLQKENRGLTITEIGQKLDVSRYKAHWLVELLLEKGLVRVERKGPCRMVYPAEGDAP